jgi:hypothetical protein
MEITETKTKKEFEPGIRGWLILPLLALVIQPISFVSSLAGFFKAVNPFRISLNIYILIYNILVILLTLHVAYFFFKKKAITPVYFILYRAAIFIPWVYIYFLGEKYPLTSASRGNLAQPLIAHAVGLLILIPYFLFSKRVKATFTLPLGPGLRLEGFMVSIQPFFDRVGAFLNRAGKFLIPGILAFILLNIFLAILFTS